MSKRSTGDRRLVDYLSHDEDNECALLGALGFGNRFIEKETGLRDGQIAYRLRKAEIFRSEFRSGQGRWAKIVLRNVRDEVQAPLTEYLRRYSPEPDEPVGRRR